MQTWVVIAINGVIAAIISLFIHWQSAKKNKNDFFNTQLLSIESDIDYINDKTYDFFQKTFSDNFSFSDNDILLRGLTKKMDTLLSKILVYKDFGIFNELVTEYNIFSTNVTEATDKASAKTHLDTFDDIYKRFKEKLYKHHNKINV